MAYIEEKNKNKNNRYEKQSTRNTNNGDYMKMLIKFIPIIFLIIIYIYILAIDAIPKQITIFEGEDINFKLPIGISIHLPTGEETVEASNNKSKSKLEQAGSTKIEISAFDNILIKDVKVDVLPKTKVIPVGSIAGVKLYTNGVLVVGMSEIEGEDKKIYKPYEETGIKEGDTILTVNNVQISSTEDLVDEVNKSKGEDVKIEYIHEEQTQECSIKPVKTAKAEYKLGLWVRDSAAGVGTVTFFDKQTKGFAALGHGLLDIDTEQLINIASGEFVSTKILKIEKGEKGNPGRIQGTLENQEEIGTIKANTNFGIYGKVENIASLQINSNKEMDVATRDEIQTGKAEIMCCLENGKIENYEIEITRIFKENNYDNKSMKIKVTDSKLIEKTGGIIQGMSGSPIIQNGKFVGAVTHVLVNEPKEGYAVFGDIMVKQLYNATK